MVSWFASIKKSNEHRSAFLTPSATAHKKSPGDHQQTADMARIKL